MLPASYSNLACLLIPLSAGNGERLSLDCIIVESDAERVGKVSSLECFSSPEKLDEFRSCAVDPNSSLFVLCFPSEWSLDRVVDGVKRREGIMIPGDECR